MSSITKNEIDKEARKRVKKMSNLINNLLKNGDVDGEKKKVLREQIDEFREFVNEKSDFVERVDSHISGGGGELEIREEKPKKARKEMTPEEKAALVERLRIGREKKKAEKAASSEEDKPEEAKAKEKKPRKEMTPEQKATLVERLRAGREKKKAEKAEVHE